MPDPTPYPPPQLVATYSGGRYHIDIAGFAGQIQADSIDSLCTIARRWAEDARAEVVL